MEQVHGRTRIVLSGILVLMLALGILLVMPTPVLAQGPEVPLPPGMPPVGVPGSPGLPDAPRGPAPNPAPTQEDCHIGHPDCNPVEAQGLGLGFVHIWHGRPFGATYRAGELIYITMSHDRGGYVYLFDWQPYMGQWPRLIGAYWLPAGYSRTIVARVVPPYGPEWLTVYDPYSGSYDRTYFVVR